MKASLDIATVREFALDVWQDLRETGLAGVAVGMAVAFVAISAIVLRPAGPPEIQTGYAAASAAPTKEIAMSVPGEEPLEMADIDLSAPRDPFRTLDAIDAGPAGDQTLSADTVMETTVASTAGGSGGGSTTTAPAAYDESDELVPLDEIETAGGGDPAPPAAPRPAPEPKAEITPAKKPAGSPATDYSYAADVQFGPVGSLTRYRSVQRLGFVPSRKEPLLMYLGVKADHKTAVFMVDSRLSQGGEGKCLPKPSLCTFLELSARAERDEHRFRDADGAEYLVRMLRVVRTTASAGSIGGPDLSALPGTPDVVDGSR